MKHSSAVRSLQQSWLVQIEMSRHQVMCRRTGRLGCLFFTSWLLLQLALVAAQCPEVAVNCVSPYVLQCGVCVIPSATQCGAAQILVNGICSCNLQYPIGAPSNYPAKPYVNQPATPCPNQPAPPCPQQPVTPSPNPPVSPCPQQPVTPCPNQPTAPCPQQPVTPCPNPPVSPCPQQPVTPSPNPPVSPCPQQPVTPCPNQPTAPCPQQPVTPSPNPPVSPCPQQPVTPSPNPPVSPCPQQPFPTTPPTITPYPEQPPPTTPPPTTTTTQLTPYPLTKCPPGTIEIRGICRLVYCSTGIYISGQCVQPVCPTGTIWTGIRCAPLKPIELINVHREKTLITQVAGNDVVLNNVNNVLVNASIALMINDPEPEPEPTPPLPPPPPPPVTPKCCSVISPRICDQGVASRWRCYSHSQQQCGGFCSAPKIVLKAPIVQTWNEGNNLVMPPDWEAGNCRSDGSCTEATNYYDCTGCATGHVETCSSYCYQYRCSSHNCAYYDQSQYCAAYPGQTGCRPQDGWLTA